ncbi:hypothetical protein [Aldersonia kunmingensis]|uniref:hypothetical protein n=1 Tax=Aldersonia kunmingensis TaxID=408066 RepID=UPI000B0EC8FC|nr:hypothetical protein [Aldersonia kunmingensis]
MSADPQYVRALAVDGWSLDKIVGVVEPMSAEGAGSLDGGWAGLANESHQVITAFVTGLGTKVGEHWTGTAATAATDKLNTKYAPCAQGSADAFTAVGTTLAQLSQAVAAVRTAVPASVDKGVWDKVTPWDTDTEDEYYRRQAEAQVALAGYNTDLVKTDGAVPMFSMFGTDGPPPITAPPGTGWPSSDSSGNGGSPGSSPASAPTNGTQTDQSTQASTTANDGTGSGSDTTGLSDSSALTDPSATNPASADATTPAGYGGSGDAARSGLGSNGLGSSGLGGHGSAGGGGGIGGGAGGLGSPSLAAGSLSPAGLAGGSAMGAAGGAAAGRAGMAGTGGFAGAPGARGKGEDDKEHKSPGYLVTLENGNELIGQLPLTAPPVIGA